MTILLCSIKGAPTLKGGACHYSIMLFIGRVAIDSTLYNICREGCVTIPFCSIEGVPTLKGGACHYSIMFFMGRDLCSPTLVYYMIFYAKGRVAIYSTLYTIAGRGV